jgi:hypothetical protein
MSWDSPVKRLSRVWEAGFRFPSGAGIFLSAATFGQPLGYPTSCSLDARRSSTEVKVRGMKLAGCHSSQCSTPVVTCLTVSCIPGRHIAIMPKVLHM